MVTLGKVAITTKSKTWSKTKITYKTIVKKQAYERKDEPVRDSDAWQNEHVRQWFIEHKAKYFKDGGNYQINFLYSYGWRSGLRFQGSHLNFPSRAERYADETNDTSDEIYGIQIIEIN